MKNPSTIIKLRRMIFLVAALTLHSLARADDNYDAHWRTIAGGGGVCGGGSFALSGSVGQPAAEVSAGGGFSLAAGFWPAETPTLEPTLRISLLGNFVMLYWKAPASFTLQSAEDLSAQAVWAEIPQRVYVSGDEHWVAVPTSRTRQFFRLVDQNP